MLSQESECRKNYRGMLGVKECLGSRMYQTDLLTRECVGPLHHTASTSEEEEEGKWSVKSENLIIKNIDSFGRQQWTFHLELPMEMSLEFYHNKLLELLSSLLVKSNHHTYQEVGEILEMEEQKTQEEVKEEEMWRQEPMTTNSRWPKYRSPMQRDCSLWMTFPDDHSAIMFMVHNGRKWALFVVEYY